MAPKRKAGDARSERNRAPRLDDSASTTKHTPSQQAGEILKPCFNLQAIARELQASRQKPADSQVDDHVSARATAKITPAEEPLIPPGWKQAKSNRLERLPQELIDRILSFSQQHILHRRKITGNPAPGESTLAPNCQIAITKKPSGLATGSQEGKVMRPWNALAATSKKLKASVEEADRLAYLQYGKLHKPTRADTLRMSEYRKKGKPLMHRSIWLHHISVRCAFCGMEKSRIPGPRIPGSVFASSPAFNPDILCFRGCERQQWPDPIIIAETAIKYGLTMSLLRFPTVDLTHV